MSSEGMALLIGATLFGIAAIIFLAQMSMPIVAQVGPVSVAAPSSILRGL